MAKAEFELDQYVRGNLIAWNVTSQCGYKGTLTLKSGNETLFSISKTTVDHNLILLGNGNTTITTDNTLKLIIDIPQSSIVKSSIVSGAITDKMAKKVGYIYDLCIEDSNDDDYNDFYVNIVGWKNQAK